MSNFNNNIAVVGLGCILPDANGPAQFWSNLLGRHSALRTLSRRTYDWDCYKRGSDRAARVFHEPIGAEIDAHEFDWRKFKISPVDAQAINPMHLHVLEAGAQALEEVKTIPHGSAGVFIGGTGLGWSRDAGFRIRLPDFLEAAELAAKNHGLPEHLRRKVAAKVQGSLDARLRPVTDDGVVNSLTSIAAGRLALRFDLRGPHTGIDAGFASGLAAVATAVRLLLDGTVDMALAGGASECISPLDLLAFHHLAVLASGQVRPFDSAAEGTLLGEGVALFALKRLEDAIEQGERIYAVLRGIGSSSDGRSQSLLAPSAAGQAMAMQRAYAEADVDPNTVGYVECHATGTPVGDASEIHALARVFGKSCDAGVAVASAKPFVGHLRGASGAVGLLRAVLALHHRVVPAQIAFERAHPNLELESTPFFVPTHDVALEPRASAPTARAAVNSFGLGGNNYHAVLEAYDSATAPRSASRRASSPPHQRSNEPIAIVGLGGVLPDADNVAAFWKTLVAGTDTTREVPTSRWQIDRYYDADQKRLDTTYTRIGCFVEPLPDPSREFRVPPAARNHVDPGHVLAFRAAEEAIADAKLESGHWDRSRTGVIFGFIGCQGRRHLAEARLNFREFEGELERELRAGGVGEDELVKVIEETERLGLSAYPPITEDTLPGFLGSFNAARIARRFDLQGPHFVVESACASSLAAVHAAARLLRQGVVDTVIVGGVWADGQPEFFVQNCRFSALSACAITPFDERASGFVPGEGAAVLVLRRLADAERDGHHVHALIRSVEGSTDGAAGRSVYSPSAEGESLAAERTLAAAQVSPADVDYVECHGTGTALGDVTEVEACTRAYGPRRERPLLIGSVKSNIGHLMAGAGAASLLKTTLAVREGTIPASIKVQKLNPKIDFQTGPVEVVTKTRTWTAPPGKPRRAGVSGFGLGGTNYHVLLEEYRQTLGALTSPGTGSPGLAPRTRTLPIATAQGVDVASCANTLRAIAARSVELPPVEYANALHNCQSEAAGDAPYRVAIVAENAQVLGERVAMLDAAINRGHDTALLRSKGIFAAKASDLRVAAMFPGQGPQYPNMLREAAAAFPELAASLDRIDDAYERLCGRKLRPSYFTDDPNSYLQSDEDIHCAVFGVNVALFELLVAFGARFDAVMGQSAGELSAMVAARCISLDDGLRAIRERTLSVLAIESPDPGRMVTLTCGAERAARLMRDLPGYSALAADNGPSACIVSGDRAAVEALRLRAAEEGIQATVLSVSHGYHSQLIAAARPRYRKTLDAIEFRRPELAFYSTITGGTIDTLPLSHFAAHLESQFVEPVRLRQAVTALHRDGTRLFVECGPKWPLTTFVSEILTGVPYVAQATVHPKVGEVEQLHRALACLFVHRVCSLRSVRETSMSSSHPTRPHEIAAREASVPTQSASDRELELLAVLREIRDIVDRALVARGIEAAPPPVQPIKEPERPQPESSAEVPSSPSAAEISAPMHSEVISQVGANPVKSPSDVRANVQSLLVAQLVARTGYPEDMLEPDLDLEAELGIDTVKQVASLAAVREHFGLAPDPSFRMQDARSLRQAVDYLVRRITGGASVAPSIATSAPPAIATSAPPAIATSAPPAIATSAPLAIATSAPPAIATSAPLAIVASAPPAIATSAPPAIVASASPPVVASASPPVVASASPSTENVDPQGLSREVTQLLTAELVARTGYPEDMLEQDLDLEAELGIDTVKQVAALAAVRERFGLPPDPAFRMQDARTLRQAIDYLVGRITATRQSGKPGSPPIGATIAEPRTIAASPQTNVAPPQPLHRDAVSNTQRPETPSLGVAASSTSPAPVPSPARTASAESNGDARASAVLPPVPTPSQTPDVSTAILELQEYVKSLAMVVAQGMRGSSPAPVTAVTTPHQPTKPHSESPASRPSVAPKSVYPAVLLESILPQAGCPWNGEVLEVTGLTIADRDSVLPPDGPPQADILPLYASDAEGQIVAKSRRVRVGNVRSSAPPNMLDAVKDGRGASSDRLLQDYLEKCGRASSSAIEWAHSQGFTLTVGGARMPNDCAGSRAMLSLLGSCYDVASFAWFGLTGALHSLSAIERMSFHRVPGPGDEMLICARMAHPTGGFWRADVAVFNPVGELFAEISGMEGIPLLPRANDGTNDPAERAWRSFAQRLGRDSAIPEDVAS